MPKDNDRLIFKEKNKQYKIAQKEEDKSDLLKFINRNLAKVKMKKIPTIPPINYGHGPYAWMREYTTASEKFISSSTRDQILAVAMRFWDKYLALKEQFKNPPVQFNLFSQRMVNSMTDEQKIEISSECAKASNSLRKIGLIKSAQVMEGNRQKFLSVKDKLTRDTITDLLRDVEVIKGKINVLKTMVAGANLDSETLISVQKEMYDAIEKIGVLYRKLSSIYQSVFSQTQE